MKLVERKTWRQFMDWWTIPRVLGFLLLTLGYIGTIEGFVPDLPISGLNHFHESISPELIGIGLTVLIIDSANERRVINQQKIQLIREMGSEINSFARRATEELEANGWLEDGSLCGKDITLANLEDANLYGANLEKVNLSLSNLQGAILIEANLKNANLSNSNLKDAELGWANLEGANLSGTVFGTELQGAYFGSANLSGASLIGADLEDVELEEAILTDAEIHEDELRKAKTLWRATMPTGKLYDGRYNLSGDMESINNLELDTNNPEDLADFYGISVDEYLEGLAWRKQNLTNKPIFAK